MKKRERVKPAFRLYLDQEHTQFVTVTKEEYEAIDLPVVQEEIGTFKLCYRNRVLSASFVGDNRDEISVASAMKNTRRKPCVSPSKACWPRVTSIPVCTRSSSRLK